MTKLKDNYPDKQTFTYSIYPSLTKPICNHEPHHHNFAVYNTLLSIHQFLWNADFCYIFDNGKLFDIAQKQCKLQNPTYDDINWLMSQVLSGTTASFRFHCEPQTNTTLIGYGTCFVPTPKLKWFVASHSPFYAQNSDSVYDSDVDGIIEKLLTNDVSDVDFKNGKITTVAVNYRGNGDESAVETMNEYIRSIQERFSDDFVKWTPGMNVQSAFIYDGDNQCYGKYASLMSTATIGATAIKDVFQRIVKAYTRLFRKKAYLHWYTNDGMDEMEFEEAYRYCLDIIGIYHDWETKLYDVVEDDETEDESEDDEGEEEDSYDW